MLSEVCKSAYQIYKHVWMNEIDVYEVV